MKSGFGVLVRIGSVLGIILLFTLAVWWVNEGSADSFLSFAGRAFKTEQPTNLPSDTSLTTQDSVSLQTVDRGRIIRTANALFVTSDGLLVTTAAGAPYGSGSFTYEVLVHDGTRKKAKRVAWDAASRLVLLKVEGLDGGTVSLAEHDLQAGEQITIVGTAFLEGVSTRVALPGTVVYVTETGKVALSFDRSYSRFLYGARVVDVQGRTLGLLHTDVPHGLVSPAAINEFVRRFLGNHTQL